MIKEEDVIGIFDELEERKAAIIAQAQRTLLVNQECYVAKWILQNPEKKMEDYKLRFEWLEDVLGYRVNMEKI